MHAEMYIIRLHRRAKLTGNECAYRSNMAGLAPPLIETCITEQVWMYIIGYIIQNNNVSYQYTERSQWTSQFRCRAIGKN